MINPRKRDLHPHPLQNHGDDINKPPADGHKRFGLQNVNGIAKGQAMEVFDIIQATDGLHLGIFGITEPNLAMIPKQTYFYEKYGALVGTPKADWLARNFVWWSR